MNSSENANIAPEYKAKKFLKGLRCMRREKIFKAGSVVVAGAVLFAASYLVGEAWAHVCRDFGAILIGVGVIEAFFHVSFEDAIEKQVDRLGSSIAELQATVAIASGAIESGLTAVFSSRAQCLAEIKLHLERIVTDRQAGGHDESEIKIQILGISLGDFLCPHGVLQTAFRDILMDARFKIDVAILRDKCNAALHRAVREESDRFAGILKKGYRIADLDKNPEILNRYESTKCHNELKTATDYLADLVGRKVIDREKPATDAAVNAKLCGFKYRAHPMAFILIIGDEMYVENYHLAGRGGEAPVLKIARHRRDRQGDSRLFQIYDGHFKSVIENAEEITAEPPLAEGSTAN